MKRFWKAAGAVPVDGGWQVALDGRAVRTVAGHVQVVPSVALAEALAAEWDGQGETVDPERFELRDMADFAIDRVTGDPGATIETLLGFAETDTLNYRAEPDEALGIRQRQVWEPLVQAAEARFGVRFVRLAGVIHRAQPEETMARLREELAARDPFELAALHALASLAASLIVALATVEPGADAEALYAAANLEEDWQAELWGKDEEALARRARRLAAFRAAARFARLARARDPESRDG